MTSVSGAVTDSAEKTLFKSMLSVMVEGIVSVDVMDRILYCNYAAHDLLDVPYPVSLGDRLNEVTGFDLLLGAVTEARVSQKLVRGELSAPRERVLEFNVTPFAADPLMGKDEPGVTVVLHDVTQIRQLERIRRDFIANVSHELKTPLTSIKGYADTLIEGALEDQQVAIRFVEKIQSNADRLNCLVQDIIALAQIESSSEGPQLESVNLNPIVSEVLSHHESTLGSKKITVSVDCPELFWVMASKEHLIQILDNLVSNGIRYTQDFGTLTIQAWKVDKYAYISVADSGVGIAQKHLARIFERFYRVDKDRSRLLGGTGLGLSIVKHLTLSLGGEISVDSKPGNGSKFTLRLNLPG